MRASNRVRHAWATVFSSCLVAGAAAAHAQSATLLTLDFEGPVLSGSIGGSSGAPFSAPLVGGSAGIFYSVDVAGEIFSMSPQGAITSIYPLGYQQEPGTISPLMLAATATSTARPACSPAARRIRSMPSELHRRAY
jgi:hypothetical protein